MDNLRKYLIEALSWENAHASFETATQGLNMATIGNSDHGQPHTIWQLVEHIRFAQKDIVAFCIGEGYEEPCWPDDYWLGEEVPQTWQQWENCLQNIRQDREQMRELIRDENNDLFTPFPYGTGQNLFKEALLIIDHEAYHTGQIVLIRKLLGVW